jgi:hypothetical protein
MVGQITALGGVGHQHLDDGAAPGGLLDVEQGLAGHPAVLDRAVPVLLEGLDWPMMTLKPLSFRFRACAGPCTP